MSHGALCTVHLQGALAVPQDIAQRSHRTRVIRAQRATDNESRCVGRAMIGQIVNGTRILSDEWAQISAVHEGKAACSNTQTIPVGPNLNFRRLGLIPSKEDAADVTRDIRYGQSNWIRKKYCKARKREKEKKERDWKFNFQTPKAAVDRFSVDVGTHPEAG